MSRRRPNARGLAHRGGIAFLTLLCMPLVAHAQIRASEVGSVSQTIDGTKISVQYSRPRARGRNPLFGTPIVQWGETWTPGANWATTLETNRDLKLNGHPVPKGVYSVWMVVRQSGDWTFVLDPRARLFHMVHPDSSATQLRFPVKAEVAPFTEVLTWSFPEVTSTGGTLAMQWGTTRVPIHLDVEPSLTVTLPRVEAEPYLGEYTFRQTGADSSKLSRLVVFYENETLKGDWIPSDPYFRRFALIRIAPDWFVPGLYDGSGQLYEVLRPEVVFEFSRTKNKVVSFEAREEDDRVFGRGTRKP